MGYGVHTAWVRIRRGIGIVSLLALSMSLGACTAGEPVSALISPSPAIDRSVSATPSSLPSTPRPTPTTVAPTATAVPTRVVPTQAPVPVPTTGHTPTASEFARIQPNELGEIPILEYHLITNQEDRWSRSWENFRGDLERLYALRYRTVRLQDVIDDRIDVPAGFSPVVLTFDDSSPGQFTFIDQDGTLVPDPHSAVGVLEAFYHEHPDFGRHATFFVLPAADPPHNLFGQNEYQAQKLQYLVAHGMDIGNHTYWHQNLSTVGDEEVRRQIGQAAQVITSMVPGYDVDLFALPEGAWPAHRELAIRGTWHGVTYSNRAIVLVGAQPAPSPDRVDFNPLALPRIQATSDQLDLWLTTLARVPGRRYVSDGDPDRLTFPAILADKHKKRPGERQLASFSPDYEVFQLR